MKHGINETSVLGGKALYLQRVQEPKRRVSPANLVDLRPRNHARHGALLELVAAVNEAGFVGDMREPAGDFLAQSL